MAGFDELLGMQGIPGAQGFQGAQGAQGFQNAEGTQNVKPIGKTEIEEAGARLQKYIAGKADLSQRIRNAEKWFRMQHWKGVGEGETHAVRQTGWLYAAIVNKHADFLDNKPEINILPREKSDRESAKNLTKILPVVMKRAGWDEAYSKGAMEKIKYGGAVYAVLWDNKRDNGLGEISVRVLEPLNFFWEPGVEDIQDSRDIFYCTLMDADDVKALYPDVEGVERIGGLSLALTRYEYNENIDTTGKVYVVDWYYKKGGLLHYCRFCDGVVLFATENAPEEYPSGWYDDGEYPFVVDSMWSDKGTPFGFGMIDAMQETQEDIDELNDVIVRNAKQAARRRYFSSGEGINEEEFADLRKEIVHVIGNVSEDRIREITYSPLPGNYINIYESKIQELKENAFNRDVNSGGSSGTTTASGIAALQEAGSKSSRAAIGRTYDAVAKIAGMMIERIKQFYTETRSFRVLGPNREEAFVDFNAAELSPPVQDAFGLHLQPRTPIFDFDVKVSKNNAWSRAAQNQDILSFYGMGFFDPANSTKSLACLEVLEIDGKDKLTEIITANGLQQQFNAQFVAPLLQIAASVDPQLAAAAMQMALQAGIVQQQGAPAGQTPGGAPQGGKTPGAEVERQENFMRNARAEANDRTAPR